MKQFLIILLILIVPDFLFGQINTYVNIDPDQFEMLANLKMNTRWIKPNRSEKEVFSFAIKSKKPIDLSFRTQTSTKKISKWQTLKVNAHRQMEDKYWISELYFIPNETNGVQFRHGLSEPLLDPIEMIFIEIPIGYAKEKKIVVDSTSCICIQQPYYNREAWCPTNDCPEISNPVLTDVTHLIVHHAASANTSTNWPGVVRSIWDFHVNFNGWDDIGYNWLIDPLGQVYEGRGDNVRGAHFCATNSGTVGICMLGNFQTEPPKDSAVEKLSKLLAWKSCDIDIDPIDTAFHNSSGLQLNTISGHRQGCSTSCPGDLFFPLFSELRTSVENYIQDSCETIFLNTNDEPLNLSIQLYPNPTSELINIKSDYKFKFSIVDINGKIIYKMLSEPQFKFQVETNNLPEGIYFLNIKTKEGRTVKKFSVLRE